MDSKTFDLILKQRILNMKRILASKGKEYASNNDRLYNFKRAGQIKRESPEAAWLGMFSKHLVSILDLIENPDTVLTSKKKPVEYIDEKIGDAINYLVLLEGLVLERLSNKISKKVL